MRREKRKFAKERPPDPNAVDATLRLFIAVPMPPAVQHLTQELTDNYAARGWPIRWVGSESIHLTLHFLGETPPERAELLRLGLGQAVRRLRAFNLSTGQLGVFPDARRPRVLWLGLEGGVETLHELRRSIGRLLIQYEFDVEARDFHPHLTLGRVRDDPPPSLARELAAALADDDLRRRLVADSIALPVEEVVLVRSFLERTGARHVTLGRYPLATR
jgi:2'-5' RNA ligase